MLSIISHLDGTALNLHRSMTESKRLANQVCSWSEFETALSSMFRPVDYIDNIRCQLRSLKHTQNTSFDDYLSKFLFLTSELTMSDLDLKTWFVDGLREATKMKIKTTAGIETFQQARDVATQFERTLSSSGIAQINFTNNSNQNKSNNKKNSNKNKQRSQNSNNKDNNSNNSNPKNSNKIKCYSCNQLGHTKKECQTQKSKNQTQNQNQNQQPKVNIVTHKPSVFPFLTLNATIQGQSMRVLIDSGASTSVLSRATALRCGIELFPTQVEVEHVLGVATEIDGITKPLDVVVYGRSVTITFLIMDHKQHDAILGLDWIDATDLGMYPKRRMIVLDDEHIYLDDHFSKPDQFTKSILYVNAEDELDSINSWDIEHKSHVLPEHLSETEKKKLRTVLKKNKKVFAKSMEELGNCKLQKFKIKVIDNTPVRIPNYRKTLAEKEFIQEEVKRMLKAGIIEPSKSPYNFSIVVCPKPNKGKRFALDLRLLNAITISEHYPIPLIPELLDSLSGSKFFSTLDFILAYLQVELEKECREYCAFSVEGLGKFHFCKMPFGLKNAPAEFCRLMTNLLGHLDFVKIYFDDITIHSSTLEEHIEHINIVLEIILAADLRINPEKCKWADTTVTLLGFVISENTIAMDPKKVEAIVSRKEPRNITEVQSFVGMVNHYRNHYPQLADDCLPLYNLQRKNVPFVWSDDCRSSFQKIKGKLSSYPILRMFDPNSHCILSCDASGYAASAILSQKDNSGQEFVVGYYSKLFNKHELNYSTTEKELLAVVYGFLHFRHYCHGNFTEVITDHSALQWLNNLKNPSGRLARWHVALQDFDHKIIHRKGSIHGNADALSRPVIYSVTVCDDEFDLNYKNLEIYEDKCLLHFLQFGKHLAGISKKQIKRVNKLSEKIVLDNDKLYFKNKSDLLLIPKPSERIDIAKKAHALGHFGSDSVYKNLKLKYFWSNMIKDINLVCEQCVPCQRNKKYKFKHSWTCFR